MSCQTCGKDNHTTEQCMKSTKNSLSREIEYQEEIGKLEHANLLHRLETIETTHAKSIKSRIRTKAIQLFEDDILDASDDAPQGFVEETFIVKKTGNTARVEMEIKPVQGLDFIFISFTLGDTTQTA